VKIKCPKCNKNAEMPLDYSMVKCDSCDLDMSYGEYVKFIAHNQPKYSDILGDYTGSTEGQSAGSLDEWD
jgi:ribosomal protein L37AE/L43A